MDRTFTILAGVYGFVAVSFGAFGAHGLSSWLEGLPDGAQREAWWATGTQYLLAHALALGLSAWLFHRFEGRAARVAGICFAVGAAIFSGSLYAMTLTGVRALGAVTPVGGLLLLAGWAAVVVAAARPHRAI